MRRFTTDSNKSSVNQSDDNARDEFAIAQAQLTSLREHITNVGKSLISAADCPVTASVNDYEFVEVRNRRKRKSRETYINTQTDAGSTGQPIPVVIGAKGIQTVSTPQYPYAAACRRKMPSTNDHKAPSSSSPSHRNIQRQQQSKVSHQAPRQAVHQTSQAGLRRNSSAAMVIGTSLTRGLGTKLCQTNASCSTYTYPGSDIPYLRGRIRHIISPQNQPAHVLRQCGGNDATHVTSDQVIHEYKALIKEVRQCSPNSIITLCAIPPRKDNAILLNTIAAINDWMKHRAARGDGVYFVKACPQSPTLFKRDKVHFNAKGLHVYARHKFLQALLPRTSVTNIITGSVSVFNVNDILHKSVVQR